MDAEVSTHTFLTMFIEEFVCFMSCEPIVLLLQLLLCGTHGIYIHIFFFINWTLRMSDNLPERVQILCHAHLHYCTGKQDYLLSNILRFALKICFWADFYCYAVDLVKIKWHIKWKYLIQKFHDICLSYYFKIVGINTWTFSKNLSRQMK